MTELGVSLSRSLFPRRDTERELIYWKVTQAMFAVVRTGGKQYRVAAGDKIVVEKMGGDAGDSVTLGDVLLAGEAGDLKSVDGLTVSAEIIAQAKADKVVIFKKRRRQNYRRKNGHRQQHTILKILAVGKEEKKAAPKKDAAEKSDAAPVKSAPAKDGVPAKEPAPAKESKASAPAKSVDTAKENKAQKAAPVKDAAAKAAPVEKAPAKKAPARKADAPASKK